VSDSTVYNNSGGIGFVGLLTIVFIILKLTGIIAWSWFWVLSPLIFGFALWLILIIIVIIAVSISGAHRR